MYYLYIVRYLINYIHNNNNIIILNTTTRELTYANIDIRSHGYAYYIIILFYSSAIIHCNIIMPCIPKSAYGTHASLGSASVFVSCFFFKFKNYGTQPLDLAYRTMRHCNKFTTYIQVYLYLIPTYNNIITTVSIINRGFDVLLYYVVNILLSKTVLIQIIDK